MKRLTFLLQKLKINTTTISLRHRLLFLFVGITTFLVLFFTSLLLLFGINGKEEKTLLNYINSELNYITQSIYEDFSSLSVDGIRLSENIAKGCDAFFEENDITAQELANHPELLESLLAAQMQTISQMAGSRNCGGVYLLLDATVNPDAENASHSKSGIFLKKTQPTSTEAVNVQTHYLRGPAQVARDHKIGLIAQWKMEYDITGEEFFLDVMETARQNPDLALSRLYYWSDRITLEGNSEAGFLLCVPVRSTDGTVFGVCGFEVSDRMFKTLYSPPGSIYENIFTVMASSQNTVLKTSRGMIAGNSYLTTGEHMKLDLHRSKIEDAFEHFYTPEKSYGGKSTSLRLYSTGSPYEAETWAVAILMPENYLDTVTTGSFTVFLMIVVLLLLISIAVSVIFSKRFLTPVTKALHSIYNNDYDNDATTPYLEINDLFDFLAQKDKEHEEALKLLDMEKETIQNQYTQAQTEIERLAYDRKKEIDPIDYKIFLENIHTLTPKEREIFNLYLSGKSVKEIMMLTNINENTIKYHNRNIYSKLGVSSRKQLLRYATLMEQETN